MDYCTPNFGKSFTELRYQDIVQYFTLHRDETDQIEFKSFSANIDADISRFVKAICGFLNSNGGLLICGSPVGVQVPGKKEDTFTGALTPTKSILGHDQLISKISASIIPLPGSLRLKILDDGQSNFVYVFEIDESPYSPHQVKGGVYYMRIDGQTQPAPHHYVESLFRKIKYPTLEGFMVFNNVRKAQGTRIQISFRAFVFNWSPLQNALELSYTLMCLPGRFASNTEPMLHRRIVEQVLFYGKANYYDDIIVIEQHEIAESNGKVDVSMLFGAKNAPLKSSNYELDLSNRNVVGMNNEEFVKSRSENVLAKDRQDQLGTTREKTLKTLLRRDV